MFTAVAATHLKARERLLPRQPALSQTHIVFCYASDLWVVIPKLLRPIFKYHPKDLGLLCKSAWQASKEMLQEVASHPAALPGVVISVQSYGDSLNLHPHIHVIAASGVWTTDGSFESNLKLPGSRGRQLPPLLLARLGASDS